MSDIKVGDNVKVEFEAKIEVLDSKDRAAMLSKNGIVLGWYPVEEFTVIPEPVVLPTKRNALIELEGAVLWFTGEVWESINEGWYPSELQKHLDARPQANYRVIFEGEDD